MIRKKTGEIEIIKSAKKLKMRASLDDVLQLGLYGLLIIILTYGAIFFVLYLYNIHELECQIGSMLYERTMISNEKHKKLIASNGGLASLRNSYVLEFLNLDESYKEKDLRKQNVSHLKNFILEYGHDFTFVGEEHHVQVGNTDFFIDLLFYNRYLSCLVAIELKIDFFRPEHLGQLNFYLESLDHNVKKENVNSSVGLILCTSKYGTVVEYA